MLFRFREKASAGDRAAATEMFLEVRHSLKEGQPYIGILEYGCLVSSQGQSDYGYPNSQEGEDRNRDLAFRIAYFTGSGRDCHAGITPRAVRSGLQGIHGIYAARRDGGNGDGLLIFDYSPLE